MGPDYVIIHMKGTLETVVIPFPRRLVQLKDLVLSFAVLKQFGVHAGRVQKLCHFHHLP